MKIKLATYNISHCQDFYCNRDENAPVNIPKTAEFIKSFNADIVSLNEVYSSSANEEYNMQTEKLAQITGHPYFVQAEGKAFSWGTIGNAVLSKFPLSEFKAVPVLAPTEEEKRADENDWYEDRVVLYSKVKAEEKEFIVIATHFGLNRLEQERMINALCKIIDEAKLPIILMGDFNALPHSDILLPIYDRLISCADIMNNKEYTFPSFEPDRTLDYIFVSKEIEVESFEVGREIVSDHLPCIAVLDI